MPVVINTDKLGQDGQVIHPALFNTVKDGSGTWYFAIVDADGKLIISPVAIAAGTAVIGKTLPARTVVETTFSATAAIAVGTHKLEPGVAYKVVAIELHNSAAPSTGTQNLVLTLDNGTGSAYDVTLLSIDCVANAVTDLRFIPEELLCKSTDVITAALINSDAVTWGLCFKHELIT